MKETDETEFSSLLADNAVVVIDYYATWCGPCKGYSPKFNRLEREVKRAHPGARIVFRSVDIDRHQGLAKAAGVMSVPTTVAWTLGKSLFGKPKQKELLRFSGDRSWNDLLRTFMSLADKHAGDA